MFHLAYHVSHLMSRITSLTSDVAYHVSQGWSRVTRATASRWTTTTRSFARRSLRRACWPTGRGSTRPRGRVWAWPRWWSSWKTTRRRRWQRHGRWRSYRWGEGRGGEGKGGEGEGGGGRGEGGGGRGEGVGGSGHRWGEATWANGTHCPLLDFSRISR